MSICNFKASTFLKIPNNITVQNSIATEEEECVIICHDTVLGSTLTL